MINPVLGKPKITNKRKNIKRAVYGTLLGRIKKLQEENKELRLQLRACLEGQQ